MKLDHIQVRTELLEYFNSFEFSNPYAVTLTMVTKVWRDITQNFRHFMNRLNRKYIGKSFHTHNNRLSVIPIIEGTSTTRFHYHAIIDNPYEGRDLEFRRAICESWEKTELGYPTYNPHSVVIKEVTDNGWIDYMMKFRTKTDIYDSVDWSNVHLR